MRSRAFILALVMLAGGASRLLAQTGAELPVENLTVTGARTRQAVKGFVQSLAQPTRATGKIARWQDPVCPTLVGLKREFATFITQHIRDIAAQAGAPVSANAACMPNIVIVFTTAPHALLDNVKTKQPALLGYYDNSGQLDALAKMNRPIQAWYLTETRDMSGKVDVDGGKTKGSGLEIYLPCPEQPLGCLVHLPNAHAAAVTGSRLGDGPRSGLYNVVIVANPNRLAEYEMGTLSDYIAMLALTQVKDASACLPLPTILNLLVEGCDKSNGLTDNDRSFLAALYKMSPDRTAQVERDEMTFQMQKSLGLGDGGN
jgi:hypothetical protein